MAVVKIHCDIVDIYKQICFLNNLAILEINLAMCYVNDTGVHYKIIKNLLCKSDKWPKKQRILLYF